jgi:hypothetical protein
MLNWPAFRQHATQCTRKPARKVKPGGNCHGTNPIIRLWSETTIQMVHSGPTGCLVPTIEGVLTGMGIDP